MKLSPVEIAARARPAVVSITVPSGFGTGFIIRSSGWIVTSLQVVLGAKSATVQLDDGREFKEVDVLGVDYEQDLALLQIPALDLPALPSGDSRLVRPGERVLAISNSLGLGQAVSDGLVSAVRQLGPTLQLFQVSTQLAPGSSGGPVINEQGEVIGIARLITTRGQTLTFAVPIQALDPLLASDTATPLDRWRWAERIAREVPRHDPSLLADCSPSELETIVEQIDRAISIGAPLYNDGNAEACFRIYQATAFELDRRLTRCTGLRRALLAGTERAEGLSGYEEKAWAMRDAFDGLLEVIERYAESLSGASPSRLPPVPPRAVPHHPLSLLDGCPGYVIHGIASALADAISVGAPLYNKGHFEACYRVYEGAVLEIERRFTGCERAKRALGEGLIEAEQRASYSDKAWALRDAFDGMLDVIGRLPSPKN